MQRLLRDTDFHQSGIPSMIGSNLRCPSPYFGCSILTTSAPKSASKTVANGAATMLPSIPSFPRRRESRLFVVYGKLTWMPVFAGMTSFDVDCLEGRYLAAFY